MRLFIAEKPSLGRAIAAALPNPHQRGEGFIKAGNDDVVSWCVGHLLELAQPEAYDPAFKRWSHEHLPIVPSNWRLQPKAGTRKQLSVLGRLIRQASEVVHAGDPDREGQLLVDQVMDYLGRDPSTAQRLLINDLNPPAVAAALARLRPNAEFGALSTSARARARADWLYGINLTRAYTLQGRSVNYDGVLSVGRVQTPVLGLVVRRDAQIDAFVPRPFHEVWANIETLAEQGSEAFRARWVPSDACARYLDEDGRNLSRPLAQNVAARVSHQPGTVTAVERKPRRQRPPLPHSLSSLQIDAARIYRMPAQQVLDVCQALYERHRLITYPRSEGRHLPLAHHAEAAAVLAAIRHNPGSEALPAAGFDALDLARRGPAWNDSKVGAHHAIIPTQGRVAQLDERERQVYGLIARNYLAQFLPDHRTAETRVTLQIAGGRFVARSTEVVDIGWKVLLPPRKAGSGVAVDDDGVGAPPAGPRLPALRAGQQVHSLQADVVDRETAPPARFTDATLLAAMAGIGRFVDDDALRKVLRDTDGLGTEATRAGIIELLFARGFLTRVGRHIESTSTGRILIQALPPAATLPDMTARWEATLGAIRDGGADYGALMTPLVDQVTRLVRDSRSFVPRALAGQRAPGRTARGRSVGRGRAAGSTRKRRRRG